MGLNIMSKYGDPECFFFRFRCTVDMKCMVSYIHWYHEMENGTEVLLRVRSRFYNFHNFTQFGNSEFRGKSLYPRNDLTISDSGRLWRSVHLQDRQC